MNTNKNALPTVLESDKLPFPVLIPKDGNSDPDKGAYYQLKAQAMRPDYRAPDQGPEVAVVGYGVDRSRVMAEAEDEFRTRAVENRNVSRAPQELVDKLHALSEVRGQLDDPKPRIKRFLPNRQERLGEEAGRLQDEVAADGTVAYGTRRQAIEATHAQYQLDLPSARSIERTLTDESSMARASHYDFMASKIGDWAGALYDQPLSQAFLEAYPGIEFTPKNLAYLEFRQDQLKGLIDEYENPRRAGEDISPDKEAELEAMRQQLSYASELLDAARHELGIGVEKRKDS